MMSAGLYKAAIKPFVLGAASLAALALSVGGLGNGSSAEAEAQPKAAVKTGPVSRPIYVTKAPIIMLKDLDSGAILFSRGADRRFAPASMTKVMTAYVILDLIKDGRLKTSDQFQMTDAIWAQWNARKGNSTMFLRSRERVSVDKLLMGLITVSGNDAATLLAVGVDASEEEFVRRMNRVAADIGMTSSQFGTPSGWPDGGRTMVSAEDMIRLADRLIRDHPEAYARYFSQPSLSHGVSPDKKPIVQRNRNPILGRFEGADGLKTGYTAEAGYCFLGSAKRDGRRLIMVVAGMNSERERRDEAERLMTWGFSAWEGRVMAAQGTPMLRLDVNGGTDPAIVAENSMAIRMTVPRGHDGRFRAAIHGATPWQGAIAKGDKVADFVMTPAGLPPQITPLVADRTVEAGGVVDQARTGWYRMTGL